VRPNDPVRSVYRKYDGSLHWHTTLLWLGEDMHGAWLGAAPGGVSRRGSEPSIVLDYAYATLVPRDGWWTAIFNAPGRVRTEIYCDVTTPPQWHLDLEPPEFTMIDLDLDVIRRRDGDTFVDDEDEFLEHQAEMSYPPEVVEAAERACRWLRGEVSGARPPFDVGTYQPWLDRIPPTWPWEQLR
jgi:protein associated with RNAse G/E